MTVLAAIRQGIAAKLTDAIDELQVSAFMLADPSPPAAHVVPTQTIFDAAFSRGADDVTLMVEVFVSDNAGDEGAQLLLDEYLEPFGARSVKQALEVPDDPSGRVTLGGACYDLRVQRVEGYRIFQREGRAPALGSQWVVHVTTPGEEED